MKNPINIKAFHHYALGAVIYVLTLVTLPATSRPLATVAHPGTWDYDTSPSSVSSLSGATERPIEPVRVRVLHISDSHLRIVSRSQSRTTLNNVIIHCPIPVHTVA
eukprot:7997931-Pyramimonas_sp.AAC.3